MKASEQCFVALDNLSKTQVLDLLPKLKGRVLGIKIGLEMFLAHGSEFVREAKELFQGQIFLDLKLHDIPNTVSKAISSLKGLPVDFLTVHASGGEAMLKAAHKSAAMALPNATILAVTVLTSLDDNDTEEVFAGNRAQTFKRLLSAIENSDCGLVCSGAELSAIGNKPLVTMVPGIRFEEEISSGKIQDQKSVFTPKQAIELGASYIVIGRSITANNDIESALKKLETEF